MELYGNEQLFAGHSAEAAAAVLSRSLNMSHLRVLDTSNCGLRALPERMSTESARARSYYLAAATATQLFWLFLFCLFLFWLFLYGYCFLEILGSF